MCYHVSRPSVRALKNEHKDGIHVSESERYGAYDHPELPAIFITGQADFTQLEWPLIPHWAADLEHARKLQESGYNARAETMFEKSMFRDAAKHSRCLFWLDGFYEWQHLSKKKKVQYFIHMPDRELFAVGGLYSKWCNPADGEVFHTCTIVTTEANELMAEIHSTKKRMPLILQDEARGVWLNHGVQRHEVERVPVPLVDGILEAEVISEDEKREVQFGLF